MVVRRGGVLMPLDRHPLVVFLLGWAVFVGFGGAAALMFGDPRPEAGLLPAWLDLSWYLLLGAGGLVVLAGTWWRDAILGVLIARAGYWPLGAGGVCYTAALLASGQVRSGIVICGFAAACIVRAVMIRRDMRAELGA